jgi:hypothetical protein
VTSDAKFTNQLRALRTPTHKYIWSSTGHHELYNLADDPGETQNIIAQEPETAATLARRLEDWLAEHALDQDDGPGIDEGIASRLEALGYI